MNSKAEKAWEGAVLSLKQMLYELEKTRNPLCARRFAEFYLLHEKYDVEVVISLKNKASQKKLGEKMFGGKTSANSM